MSHDESRQCEMKIPDFLVEQMESDPGGIEVTLSHLENEYGISTTSPSNGKKYYTILGPGTEILEMAIESLQNRYLPKRDRMSNMSGEIEVRKAVWKFQGDYASKATQLFQPELDELCNIPSIKMTFLPETMEITTDYTYADEAKVKIEQLQSDIDNLYQDDTTITDAEIDILHEFMEKKQKFDRTVAITFNERKHNVTVFGKSESTIRKVMDEWATERQKVQLQLPTISLSPNFSHSPMKPQSEFTSEIQLPREIMDKLEKQRGGIIYLIPLIEKEFGLKIEYVRKEHFKMYGANMEVLQSAVQTLTDRYISKSPLDNGVEEQLQGKNVVWKFMGNYAKKVVHLFPKQLHKIERIRTVTLKFIPGRIQPNCIEILCSCRVIEIVKSEIDKLLGLVHNLFEKDIEIDDDREQINKIKNFIKHKNNTSDLLYSYDERTRKLWIYGKNEMLLWKAVAALEADRKKCAQDGLIPDKYWKKHRELYQTKIPADVVQKLEAAPDGIMPLIQKIEKEYGVRALYHRNKQMVLLSQTREVLELAQETIETRYTQHTKDADKPDNSIIDKDTKSKTALPNIEIVKIQNNNPVPSKIKSTARTRTVTAHSNKKSVSFFGSTVTHTTP